MRYEMKIEILFPEFCNLFGDMGNIQYLKKCLPEAIFVETSIKDEPAFMSEKVDMIYMAPMTERGQIKVIEKLKPYKEKIEELIKNNTVFLFVGNALETLGKYIEIEDGSKIEALNIFDIYAKRDINNRRSSLLLGMYEDIEMVGFKSQFTTLYGDNTKDYFVQVQMGEGINENTNLEGIKKNNFIGTYIIGPILVLNPLFTKKFLEMLGVENPKLAFEEDVIAAYNQRLSEFKKLNSPKI